MPFNLFQFKHYYDIVFGSDFSYNEAENSKRGIRDMRAIYSKNKVEILDIPFIQAKEADFWRIFLDDGVYREITVHSFRQTPIAVRKEGDTTTISYDRLIAEDGKEYAVDFSVHISEREDTLYYSFDIESKCDVRVNEVMCPYLDFAECGCKHEDEELFYPDGLGRRVKNPRKFLERNCHTEYISSDYHGITKSFVYPSYSLTMPWLSVQAGCKLLYVASHSEALEMKAFTYGTNPRNAEESRLTFAVSYYPAAVKGEKLHYGESVVKLFDGDWRAASRFYRDWCDAIWFEKRKLPEWIRNMTGWQRIIMKHQYGEIFFRYDDLPKFFKIA